MHACPSFQAGMVTYDPVHRAGMLAGLRAVDPGLRPGATSAE
jgi:hypothetical protein